ncbi:MAG TPA: hypothetical protein VIM74_06740 [Casimicrobiaceae bacterium]
MDSPAVIAMRCREVDAAPLRFAGGASCRSASRLALRLALAGMLALSWSAATRAEWLFDVDAGARYESNLTRAQEPPDVRGDGAATLFASAGSFFALTGADGLTLDVNAATETWHRFHGLDRMSIGGTASYKHKFGLGYAAPWVSLGLSGSHDNYRSAIRDSDRLEARAELGQRFSEAFDASVGAVYDRRYARNDRPVVPGISGRVFDVHGKSAYVRAGYALSERLQAGANFVVRRGDVVSTTRRHREIFLESDAIAADPAFGDDFFAYRLRGTSTTQTAAVTLSWAFSDRSSLNFRYADERTSAYEGLDYRGRITALAFAFSY